MLFRFMLSHGLIASGLFFLVGFLYNRFHVRSIENYSGLGTIMPIMSMFFFVFTLANIAFPLTSGFIGEFLLLNAVFHYNYWLGGIVAISIILGAVYMLRLFQKSMLGTNNGNLFNGDLSIKEHWIIIPLMIFVIAGGIFPNWVNEFLF